MGGGRIMPDADYFGGKRDIGPFIDEAWKKLPIVNRHHLPLYGELMAKHFNAGHTWRAILKDDIPADFLKADEEASVRENHEVYDEDDSPFYKSAREDFEELCGGVMGLFYRAVHEDKEADAPLNSFPGLIWIKPPFDECAAADENDGKFFSRDNRPALPHPDCTMRFCGCTLRLASRNEVPEA
jgi:hypothetical protein